MEETIYDLLMKSKYLDVHAPCTCSSCKVDREKRIGKLARTIVIAFGCHVCDLCEGTGEISSMAEVEPGNGATMADVGDSRPCPNMPHLVL